MAGLLETTYDLRSSDQQLPVHQRRSTARWSKGQQRKGQRESSSHWVTARRGRQRQRELRQQRIAF